MRGIAVVVLGLLALWGAWNLRDVVNPATVLATPADVAAIEWVVENTPADARFLINAAPWLSTADRGADGGWWLLPLAGRWTSTPPVLYVYGPPDYVPEVRARNAVVIGFKDGHEQQLYQLLDQERIDYIYLGPRSAPLTPAMFMTRAGFDKVYERDGVTILAVSKRISEYLCPDSSAIMRTRQRDRLTAWNKCTMLGAR